MKKSIRKTAPPPPVNQGILREVSEEREHPHASSAVVEPASKSKYSSDESSDEDEEDTRMLEGNVYTKSGFEVTERKSMLSILSRAKTRYKKESFA